MNASVELTRSTRHALQTPPDQELNVPAGSDQVTFNRYNWCHIGPCLLVQSPPPTHELRAVTRRSIGTGVRVRRRLGSVAGVPAQVPPAGVGDDPSHRAPMGLGFARRGG